MKRLFFAFFMLVLLTGCQSKGEAGAVRFDIERAPRTLDPQTATDDTSLLVISNIFEGLTRLSQAGEPVPAAASGWELAPDGLTYTFHLREDLKWADGQSLDAEDFVFALRRVIDPKTNSPHAAAYLALQHAAEIQNGTRSVEQLGVFAPDKKTVVLKLDRPDDKLLRLLAKSSSMPCREDFFFEQKGRYGMSPEATLSNGPLHLVSWSSEILSFEPNGNHSDPPRISRLYFCIGRGNPADLFLEGRSEVCLIPHQQAAAAKNLAGTSIFDQSWVLVVNPASFVGKDETLRRAIIGALDKQKLSERLFEGLLATDNLVCQTAMINGAAYRETVGNLSPANIGGDIRASFHQRLGELGVSKPAQTTLLVSDFSPGPDIGTLMQRKWIDKLSANINMEQLEYQSLAMRFASGNYDLILAPISSDSSRPEGYLTKFSSFTVKLGGEEVSVSQELARLAQLPDSAAAKEYRALEQALVEQCFVLPLYEAASVFATSKKVSGVQYDLYNRTVYFGNAVFLEK